MINNEGYETSVMVNIISALEKQTPKKVLESGKYGFACPNCKEEFGIQKEDIYIYDMDPPKYCSNCGQKLGWEDFVR